MRRRLAALILGFLMCAAGLSARPTVALVLSGGGARGLVHIPIIAELERRGIVPDMVLGTSMGGLVGGLYAAGYSPQELEDFILSIDFPNVVFNFSQASEPMTEAAYDDLYDRNLSLAVSKAGLGDSEAMVDDSQVNLMIHQAIAKLEWLASFDDMPIPFRCVGTDFRTGGGVIFDSGSLYEALRGTMSIPVMFPYVVLDDGTYVVDGGVYNNMPVDLARSMGADIVIAVDVNEDVRAAASAGEGLDTLSGSLNQYLTVVGQNQVVQQYVLADYIMIPDTGGIGTVDFFDIPAILETGRAYVEDNQAIFDAIEAELSDWLPMEDHHDYSQLGYTRIEGFRLDEGVEDFSGLFEPFVGEAYDEETLGELAQTCELVRRMANLMSVTFHMEDGGQVRVKCRSYLSTPIVLTAGLSGGLESWTDISSGGFSIRMTPRLSLLADIWLDDVRLTPAINVGGSYGLSFRATWLPLRSLALTTGAAVSYGGLSALSPKTYMSAFPTRDLEAGLMADISWLIGTSQRLSLTLRYDFDLLGKGQALPITEAGEAQLWADEVHHRPRIELGYNLDGSHLEGAMETGVDFAIQIGVGWDEGLTWRLRSDLGAVIRLTDSYRSFLDLSLSLFSARGSFELASSYIVDPFGQMSADFIDCQLSYRHYFYPKSNGLYVTAGLFAEALGRLSFPSSPIAQAPYSSQWPFGELDGVEAGARLALGYLSDFGTLELAALFSYTGRMALSVTVL